MVILEALNALAGDCLLLRYPGPDGKERLWIIDGGPKRDGQKNIYVWTDVLLPRLKQISSTVPLPVALGMVSHIDDDHINGIQKLTNKIREAKPADPAPVKFSRFWFNSFDKLVGPKPAMPPAKRRRRPCSRWSIRSTSRAWTMNLRPRSCRASRRETPWRPISRHW